MRRGRPTGYKMSQKSKDKIKESKLGRKHKQNTKDKISTGVRKFHETGAPIEIIRNTNLDECGTFKNSSGYITICIPNPTVGETTYSQRLHVAIMEKTLDRKLRKKEEIHHWGEKDDNRLSMITLCHSRAEHNILDKAKKIIMAERLIKALQFSAKDLEKLKRDII